MTRMHEDAAIWLKAGYQIWASGGEPARLPEQLSRETGLPAEQFQRFFPDVDIFLDMLLEEHRQRAAVFLPELLTCNSYIPDVFEKLAARPLELLFHRRLLLKKDRERFRECYRSVNAMVNRIVYPHWANEVHYSGRPASGRRLHLQLIDLWLLRINPNDLSFPALVSAARYINQRLEWLLEDNPFF